MHNPYRCCASDELSQNSSFTTCANTFYAIYYHCLFVEEHLAEPGKESYDKQYWIILSLYRIPG